MGLFLKEPHKNRVLLRKEKSSMKTGLKLCLIPLMFTVKRAASKTGLSRVHKEPHENTALLHNEPHGNRALLHQQKIQIENRALAYLHEPLCVLYTKRLMQIGLLYTKRRAP